VWITSGDRIIASVGFGLGVRKDRQMDRQTDRRPEHTPLYPRSSQWRRSVVNMGDQGQSGQAIKLFQAPRNTSFIPSIFDTSISSVMI